ncbi:MAG: Flp family type IVb pilin [Firmicutes bacterium]|nr:Flp family type IVb pilin [Bacillota bacterium]
MQTIIQTLLYREEGQAMTEYAFILALVALVAIVALAQVTVPIVSLLQRVVDTFKVSEEARAGLGLLL